MAEGHQLRRPIDPDHEAKESVKETAAEAQRVFELLTSDIVGDPAGKDQETRWLLAHMLEYIRREAKCAWWDFFRMKETEHEGKRPVGAWLLS